MNKEQYDKLIKRANTLIEALPYIQKYTGKTFVIKYGGNAMTDDAAKHRVIQDIVLLKFVGINPVVVHGGGPELTQWLTKVNKKSEFIDGLRVTDKETVELAEMVFGGKINKEIVSLIHRHGGSAVGLGGKDGRLIIAKKIKMKKDKDLGFVGEVEKINDEILHTLINAGFIPVISSIGENTSGMSYNINADSVAEAVAIALKAEKLFMLTNVDGILDKDKQLIPSVSIKEAEKLIKNGSITGGMIPKIKGSMHAVKNGVKKVHIINGQLPHSILLEVFTDFGIGTMIKKD